MNFLTTTVARVLYGLPMIVFGVFHFMKGKQMEGIVPSFFPFKIFWVYLTGVALIAAGISIITKIQAKLASLLLALMLLIFVIFIHLPGLMDTMPNLLKDTALAAAALLMAGIMEREG
jgi:uncharacterized membrane protein